MSDARRIGWIAGEEGIVKYDPPPPPKRLSREERAVAYRTGVVETAAYLKGLGFYVQHECDYSVALCYRNINFDFRIQITANVAHVTSYRGYDPKKPARTHRLGEAIKSEYCLQMIVGAAETCAPVFLPLDESEPDPATLIKRSVIGFLSSLAKQGHRLGESVRHLPPAQRQIPDFIDV